MPEKKSRANSLIVLAPLFYLAVSVAVVMLVCRRGQYPIGSDVMYHVYRGEWIYDSIRQGNWWPLVNPMWYNGVELLRYWPPLPAYFMAFCQFLAGGNSLYGYLIFVGMICFLGALPWLFMGYRQERPWMGAFLGILWFFMPNNLFVLFGEGNLARSLSMVFLPLLIYGVYLYLDTPQWTSLALITVSFSLVTLCHLGYGGMVALGILLYLLVDKLITRRKRGALYVFAAILLGFLLLGIWLVPSLVGGISTVDSSETMQNFFQSIWVSINPWERYESNNANSYFGAAAFLVALLGVFCGCKKARAGFLTSLLILICTTSAMYPIISVLPGSQYLWMLRFISIALCFVLMSFFFWKTLRRWVAVFLVLLLMLDSIPSASLIYGTQSGRRAEDWIDENHRASLIQEAQNITEQRIALIDFSGIVNGAWHVVSWENPKQCNNGAGWEAANTSWNISQLERAALEGNYRYLFDRCKQQGCDTVVLLTRKVEEKGISVDQVSAAAEETGYRFVNGNASSCLYHLDTPGNWGTVSKYRAIAIGDVTVNGICRSFPAMKEADSYNLNEYTFEELSQYDLVYLSGFTYSDRQKAEDLVIRLSESGTRIVIAADGVPENRETRNQSFLGVICNPILFSNGYPELDTIDGRLNTDLFPADYADWSTVYLEGLDDVWGTVEEGDGVELDFYGTVKNENIVFVGLNLSYFLSLTGDSSVEALLSHAMQLSSSELPEREIVPLEVAYGKNSIAITSPENNVNTALAYHPDVFSSDREIREENNLTFVDKGSTVITLEYPHFWLGLIVNILGVILTAAFWVYRRKRETDPDSSEAPEIREQQEEAT